MSLTHIQTMLNTLIKFNDCEIKVTFHSEKNDPVLSVRYDNNRFEITYLKEASVEKYDDIKTTLKVIDQTLHIRDL